MGFSQHEKMRSLQHHSSKSSKEKGLFPSGIKNVDLLEKVGALKTEKLPRQTAKDRHEVKKNSVASQMGTSQKPWPGRKVTGFEGPVKNMSNVPFYLQRTEKGDNIHEKALNFGVLDWGVLERWAYYQTCVTNVGGGDSRSSSTDSSTYGFSNQSCRTMSSPLPQRKKSPSLIPQKKPTVIDSPTKIYEKENSGHIEGSHGSRISSAESPVQHDKHPDADVCLNADILVHKHDKGNSKYSHLKAMSREVCLVPHSAISPSRYKIDDATPTRVAEDQNGSSMKAKMLQDYPYSLPIANDIPRFPQDSKVRWDYLQESLDSGCLSSDSPLTTDRWLAERNGNNHSGNLAEDAEIIHQYPHVPHSCPLPCTNLNDEPDGLSCTLLSESVVPTDKSICRNGDNELFSRGSCKQLEVSTAQELRKSKAKAMAGKKSSDHPPSAGLKQMSKSSSLREGSPEEQFESISHLYNSHGDQATRNNKGKQSPLRRILDPLFKPKNNLALLSRHSCELSRTDKSSLQLPRPSNTSVDSTCQTRRSMNTSNQLSNNGKGIHQDENRVISMKQALLQLAWKNGLPLFMLSSCDTEVLAATITMRSASNNDNLECMYRIFSVKDSKKKSMFWSNPGNKGKKHQLISNVVGELKVSLCKLRSYEYDCSHVMREFVLLGAELAPTSHKPVDSPTKSELAAVVVNVPLHRPKSFNIGMLCRNKCRGSLSANSEENASVPNEEKCLQTDRRDDVVDQSGISVILPSGVHGLSTDGEPWPLIERWRSGGACDCGGWDEGCKLTILSDMFQAYNTSSSLQEYQDTDVTCRYELFIQGGGSQEKGHAFRIVCLREGCYAVDFLSSISLLQAFTICIAVLHGMKTNNHSAETKSLQEHIVNDQLGRAPARSHGDPTSYVPNHPPLSPVGRA